ncbi:MAG TPA: CopY family transcriptional regulator [Actinobacteria bacterium]|nr:CopY family transcriptional regulator [Actinomycetota bacterium]
MRTLGELEAAVMACLWQSQTPVSVRDVMDRLNADRDLAYTTVLTVLDNLHRKQMVTRELNGRAYQYVAAKSQGEYSAELIAAAAAQSDDKMGALMHFVERLSPQEVRELRAALDAQQPRKAAPATTERRASP